MRIIWKFICGIAFECAKMQAMFVNIDSFVNMRRKINEIDRVKVQLKIITNASIFLGLLDTFLRI